LLHPRRHRVRDALGIKPFSGKQLGMITMIDKPVGKPEM
jgi:hypothetical protein